MNEVEGRGVGGWGGGGGGGGVDRYLMEINYWQLHRHG